MYYTDPSRRRRLPPLITFGWCLLLLAGGLRGEVPATWTYVDAEGRVHAFEDCPDNVTDGGEIGTDARGCANPSFQPARLTNVTSPSGGTGELEYLWMVTTADPRGRQPVSWSVIPGSTDAEYTPTPLTQTAYFMRCARRVGCDEWAGESNYVTITIDCCDPIGDGGRIGGEQRNCGLPYDPSPLTNLQAADATGGLPLTYSWYASTTSDAYVVGDPAWTLVPGETSPFLDPGAIATTTYYVRVAQRQRCDVPGAFSNVVTVEAYPQPAFKEEITDVTCDGATDGTIAVTVLQAADPFVARWADDAGAGLTRTDLAAGTYTLTLTDAHACEHSQTFTVKAPAQLTVAATATFDRCAFTSADLDAAVTGGTAPYFFTWDTGDRTQTVTGVPAGTYEVIVTDANNCTAIAGVEVAPRPELTATATSTQPTCGDANGEIAVSPAGGTAPFRFAWTGPGVADARVAIVSGLAGGDYAVTVSDANDCSVRLEVTLATIAPLAIGFDADEVQCAGAADAELRSSVTGGTAPYAYRWNTGATTASISGIGSGTYTLAVTDALGCTSQRDTVLADASGLNATIAAEQPSCAGETGTLTVTATGGAGGYRYVWRETGARTATISGLAAGTYTVDVTDANGCTTFATAEVTEPAPLTGRLTVTQPTCGDANGAIAATVSGGTGAYTYAWTPAAPTRGNVATITDLPGGTYGLTVTDANGCTLAPLTATLDEVTPLTLTLEADELRCNGATTADIRSTAGGGSGAYTYAWDDGPTTADRTGLGAGTYTLTVTDANSPTCTREATVTIAEPTPLAIDVSVVQPICHDDGGSLIANVAGGTAGYTYDWGTARPDNERQTLNNAPAGTYTLTVTDANGCTADTTAEVTAPAPLIVELDSTDVSCPGDTTGAARATVSGGEPAYQISWSNGVRAAAITSLPAGTYTAIVRDARGCTVTKSTTVETRSTGPVTTDVVTQPSCHGDPGAIDLTTTGGVLPYRYAWADDPAAGPDRTGLAGGDYAVRVTDAEGCFTDEAYVITEPELLEATATPTTNFPRYFHVSAFEATDGGARAEATGGTPPYTYSWSTGATDAALTGLAGGDYTVTVRDANGCLATHDTTLVEPSMISDYVWEDTDGDGLQDADEAGLGGVSVRLTGVDFMGVSVDLDLLTAADGSYRFDQLAMGDYVLRFRPDADLGLLSSPQDEGADDALDSDMDPRFRFVERTVAAHGTGDYDTDAGFIPPTSVIEISDRVWYDADHDGIQDPFESPVQGVSLELVRVSDGAVVQTTSSTESGSYAFTDVPPGTYYVRFDQSTSSVASMFVASAAFAGADTTRDSDFFPATKRSPDVLVTADSEDITTLDLGLHEDCATVLDAGAIAGNEDVCEGSVAGAIASVSPASGSVSYRWFTSTATGVFRGPNDPAWTRIDGATGETYQPSILVATRHYVRLASDVSCGQDYTAASNVVTKTVIPRPVAAFRRVVGSSGSPLINGEIVLGRNETLEVAAETAGVASFAWDFGADATPQTASAAAVTGVAYAIDNGSRSVTLTVTNAQGCIGAAGFDVTTIPVDAFGRIGGSGVGRGDRGATLTWSAISLPLGARFDVQRSTGRGAFATIASVPAKAYGQWVEYAYEDLDAPAGTALYRVVQRVPQDPHRASDFATAELLGEDLGLVAYPNPATDAVTVEVTHAAGERSHAFELTNVYGAIVRRGDLATRETLAVDDLPAGTYYLRVTSAEGTTVVRPIVKR